jgi:hypothetical protein
MGDGNVPTYLVVRCVSRALHVALKFKNRMRVACNPFNVLRAPFPHQSK